MTKRALVVTTDLDVAGIWMAWLRAEGFMTTGCAGPDLTFGCPARRGAACLCRDVADVTVVDLESDIHRRCGTEGAQDAIVIRPSRSPSVAERADFRGAWRRRSVQRRLAEVDLSGESLASLPESAAIERAVPRGSAAGDRYHTTQMASLDSERRGAPPEGRG